MQKTKYGLYLIEKTDTFELVRETHNKSSIEMVDVIDRINERLIRIENELEYLKRLYYHGGDDR